MIKTIAVLGAGKLGVVLAQLAIKAGYTVYIAGSGSSDKIRLSMNVLAPGSIAARSKDAISKADMVILALPLNKYRKLDPDDFAGKLVIDSMNYWWEVDGDLNELEGDYDSTSEMVQAHLHSARVVKALSHMGYHHLHDEARQDKISPRKAIAIAGNDTAGNAIVAKFIESLGFEPLIIGPLSAGIQLEPGHRAFGANVSRDELAAYFK